MTSWPIARCKFWSIHIYLYITCRTTPLWHDSKDMIRYNMVEKILETYKNVEDPLLLSWNPRPKPSPPPPPPNLPCPHPFPQVVAGPNPSHGACRPVWSTSQWRSSSRATEADAQAVATLHLGGQGGSTWLTRKCNTRLASIFMCDGHHDGAALALSEYAAAGMTTVWSWINREDLSAWSYPMNLGDYTNCCYRRWQSVPPRKVVGTVACSLSCVVFVR